LPFATGWMGEACPCEAVLKGYPDAYAALSKDGW